MVEVIDRARSRLPRLLVAALGAFWAVLLTSAASAAEPEERPNILLLTAEDLSPRIGAFGDAAAQTPNLDRLAAEGVRYPNTFTTAGVCAPSRAALITGVRQTALSAQHMRAGRLGGFRSVPPGEVKAFPELLRRAGYFTFTTAKLDYQFSSTFPGSGPFTIWDRETFNELDGPSAPKDQPFYGQINYNVTHESGVFPVSWPRNVVHAFMLLTRIGFRFSYDDVMDPADMQVPPYYPDTETVRRDMARHYENIRIMDEQVGETLAALERDGLADSTIIIWTTDHGDGLPRAKRSLYDSGLRVPMIIRWPERFRPDGVKPGTVDERLVSFVDLAATILSLAGVPPPEWMDGQVFAGRNASTPRRYVFASRDRLDEHPDRARAVRDERYKYIRNYAPGTPGALDLAFRNNQDLMREMRALYDEGKLDPTQRLWFEPRPTDELYDTWEDPHEVVNLAKDPAHQATLHRLQSALDDWMAERPDLSEIPEEQMIEERWPGGVQPETEPPEIQIAPAAGDDVRVSLHSSNQEASLGYRLIDGTGNAGAWKIYTDPFTVRLGTTIEARAVRYGWAESSVVRAPTV